MLQVFSKKIKPYSESYARKIGEEIGIKWDEVDFSVNEFALGLQIELEHGSHDPETDVIGGDIHAAGKITWSHLKEIVRYNTCLLEMEKKCK